MVGDVNIQISEFMVNDNFDTFVTTQVKSTGMRLMKKVLFIICWLMITASSGSLLTAQGWEADPAVVERLSKPGNEFNYTESKVPGYTLPGILHNSKGAELTKPNEWLNIRRGEVLELFRENMYGRVPATSYSTTFKIVNENKNAMGGASTLRQVDINISSEGKSITIHLSLFIPNNAVKPVPVFLLINLGSKDIDPTRQVKTERWPAEEIVARGYAAAAFCNADADPDDFDNFKNGIHGVLDRGERKPDAWGTIAAWAWGASRCLDYLVTDKQIDGKKVAVIGHSRGGKAALWAGAEDQRFSMVISNESGCGGAALARRKFGETVARINTSFPHWFCLNYRKFNNNEDSFPVDMHMLLGLIAPRALYVACADEDLWGDPKGSYLALYNALPVYRLLKTGSSLPEKMPPLNTPVTGGKVGFHIRDGVHNLLLKDWNWYMDFADKTWQ